MSFELIKKMLALVKTYLFLYFQIGDFAISQTVFQI